MGEFDFAIFGAGIAGASVAYRLAGQRSVVLIEREAQPGYHSTGRSAAMFIESYGPPAVRGEEALLGRTRGELMNAPVRTCRSWNPMRHSRRSLACAPRQCSGRFSSPPPRCSAPGWCSSKRRASARHGSYDLRAARSFALGRWSTRRSAFTFRAPEGIDVSGWPAVIGVDESYYFKPDAGRLLGSPANADPTTPHDVMPEKLDVAVGIHRIEAVTTFSIRRPESAWAGLRSFVRDGELVIGWDDRCTGFFWLAAQGGYGIQSAAAASELAAALLMALPVPQELRSHGIHPSALSPGRLR